MKAKEYFEKHSERLMNDTEAAVNDLFIEFSSEMKELLKTRKAVRNEAVSAVILEQNQKWNALRRMFREKTGRECPLAVDGFKKGWVSMMPELAVYLGEKKGEEKVSG